MDRRRRWRNAVRWCSFFASVACLSVAGGDEGSKCDGTLHPRERFLMVVSTMDGKVTALEVNNGNLAWSINTGGGPLVSSSISKLEVNRNGASVRLIPSLDGGLYQFDGSSIEPVPLAADLLLSNSYRFSEDSMVVGAKEVETCGIDVQTGKVKYICSTSGCSHFTANGSETDGEDAVQGEEVLVVTRNSRTVRAVDLRSGQEKWNFSVGEHHMSIVKARREGIAAFPAAHPDHTQPADDAEGATGGGADPEGCPDSTIEDFDDGSFFDFHSWFSGSDAEDVSDIQVKVIVPSGLVVAVTKSNPSHILWQHVFDTAIEKAWMLAEGDLSEVNLFDNRHIPALTQGAQGVDGDSDDDTSEALLYVGVHEDQLYVQPSVGLLNEVQEAAQGVVSGTPHTHALGMPRVSWNPYLASSASRTPALSSLRAKVSPDGQEIDEKALAVRKNEYPFDEGVYLFPDCTPSPIMITDESSRGRIAPDSQYYGADIAVSFWNWWREILGITLLTMMVSVFCHFLMLRYFYKRGAISINCDHIFPLHESIESRSRSASETPAETSTDGGKSESLKAEYVSRYYTDFEQVACLGKGGFGVVFEAQNKLDDCAYAIKRISLNNSDRAKEKVMREVKALAKLNHNSIVRYHQAWFENPPAGWQEEKDQTILDMVSSTPSPGYSVTEYPPRVHTTIDPATSANVGRSTKPTNALKASSFNPLRPFEKSLKTGSKWSDGPSVESADSWADGDDTNTESVNPSLVGSKKAGSTGAFVPHFDTHIESDDSSEWSEHKSPIIADHKDDNSFVISFGGGDMTETEDTQSSPRVPFGLYDLDSESTSEEPGQRQALQNDKSDGSMDIVFEDSGCGDKSPSNSISEEGDHVVVDILSASQPYSSNRKVSPAPTPEGMDRGQLTNRKRRKGTGSTNDAHKESVMSDSTRPSKPSSRTALKRPTNLSFCDSEYKAHSATSPQPKLYLYIQMQLCRKESLKDWLSANTLNRDRNVLLDIFHQTVSAVDYVHDSGLMHRDLKPSNIFFSIDGMVKIGDFGLATALEESGDGVLIDGVITPIHTGNKHTDQVGTRLYMSPEQNAGKKYTHKVDIYAMGLIFFELFYPFATQMERIKSLVDVKNLLFPERFTRELPDECKFVRTMLARKPSKRPSTKDILQHAMLKEFEDVHKMLVHARARSTSRIRSYSTSSNHSGSGSPPL